MGAPSYRKLCDERIAKSELKTDKQYVKTNIDCELVVRIRFGLNLEYRAIGLNLDMKT